MPKKHTIAHSIKRSQTTKCIQYNMLDTKWCELDDDNKALCDANRIESYCLERFTDFYLTICINSAPTNRVTVLLLIVFSARKEEASKQSSIYFSNSIIYIYIYIYIYICNVNLGS